MQQRIPKTNQPTKPIAGENESEGTRELNPWRWGGEWGERNQGRNWEQIGNHYWTNEVHDTSSHPIVYPHQVFFIDRIFPCSSTAYLYPYLFFLVCAFLSLRSLHTRTAG